MNFRKYKKIHRLGKEETDGVLNGTCYIEEKVDGANLSVWKDEHGELHVGSRNNDVTNREDGFNGAVAYVKAHDGIVKLLNEYPEYQLYGEWLVKHSVNYNELAYKKFYLFDIYTKDGYLTTTQVHDLAREYKIEEVPLLAIIENPTEEQIKSYIGSSKLEGSSNMVGEGIVIKNHEFRNNFGDKVYAKVVTEKFRELNAIVFGGNARHSDNYYEQYVVNKYMTLSRVQKIVNKIQPLENERLSEKHLPRIMSSSYHDMLVEEIWEIQKKCPEIKFKVLSRIAQLKAKQIYLDILNGNTSVAYQ